MTETPRRRRTVTSSLNEISAVRHTGSVYSESVAMHPPSIRSHRGTKVVWPDIQPMRVPEEPVWIDLFRQKPVFTSLHMKYPVHVVPPLTSPTPFFSSFLVSGQIFKDDVNAFFLHLSRIFCFMKRLFSLCRHRKLYTFKQGICGTWNVLLHLLVSKCVLQRKDYEPFIINFCHIGGIF